MNFSLFCPDTLRHFGYAMALPRMPDSVRRTQSTELIDDNRVRVNLDVPPPPPFMNALIATPPDAPRRGWATIERHGSKIYIREDETESSWWIEFVKPDPDLFTAQLIEAFKGFKLMHPSIGSALNRFPSLLPAKWRREVWGSMEQILFLDPVWSDGLRKTFVIPTLDMFGGRYRPGHRALGTVPRTGSYVAVLIPSRANRP